MRGADREEGSWRGCFSQGQRERRLVCIDGTDEMEKRKEVSRGADGCGRV